MKTVVILAALLCGSLRADILFGPTVDYWASSSIEYAGGNAPLTGFITPSFLVGTDGTDAACLACVLNFITGPGVVSDWAWEAGGAIGFTGGVDTGSVAIPDNTQLFTGQFQAVNGFRCDVDDPGELCLTGTFTGILNPTFAALFNVGTNVTGGFSVVYLLPPSRADGACDPNVYFSCGPWTPEAFIAPSFGPGGGIVRFDPPLATPEPASWFLLAGVFLFCGMIAKRKADPE